MSTNFLPAGLSLERKSVSHAPRAHVHYCVDRCLRLVYQPVGVSSCSRHLIGMNVVFFDRVLSELGNLPFLTNTLRPRSAARLS